MSQRQTIILKPFSFCSLEYAGAKASITVAFPVILLPFLPKNVKNMGSVGEGALRCPPDTVSAFYLVFVLSSFYLNSALNFSVIWACSALSFCHFH